MSLKKYLQQFTKEQLIEQIAELDKKFKDVKAYYEFSLNPNSGLHEKKIKKAIHKYFNPPQGVSKLREARKEVTEFKKLSPPEESLADIMLYYVECGVEFTRQYGEINGSFYDSVASMFYDVCEFIRKNGLRDIFRSRCKKVMDDSDGIGWGFHDELAEYYYINFEKK